MPKKWLISFWIIIFIIGGTNPTIRAEQLSPREGLWLGTLKVPGTELRIGFEFQKIPDGPWSGFLNSIDQGAMNIPVDEVLFTQDSLHCSIHAIQGRYDGLMTNAGNIIGHWKQGGGTFALTLDRVDHWPLFNRPQYPKKPFPYHEEEVRYENKEAGIYLAGTLTLPDSGGLFTAVVLLTGSGPQNRDEEVFQHKPFLVLSDYLTRRGIAVLRADDRGVGQSTGNFGSSTTSDFTDDALAGVAYLKTREEINPKRIGLIGHSEGGTIASIAAVQSSDVAFIVMMAGPGIWFGDIVIEQIQHAMEQQGVDENTISAVRSWYHQIYSIVGKSTSNSEAETELRTVYTALNEQQRQTIHWPPERFEKELSGLLNPWWRYNMAFSPEETFKQVKCPVLSLNGEKDIQVYPKENLKAIREGLSAGGNPHFEVIELPGLNHLFQVAETGEATEYTMIEETMSPEVMKIIADWIAGISEK